MTGPLIVQQYGSKVLLIQLINNVIISAVGDGLISHWDTPDIVKILNNTLIGEQDQQHLMSLKYNTSEKDDKFVILNNIFYKGGSLGHNNVIKFEDLDYVAHFPFNNGNNLNYNLYWIINNVKPTFKFHNHTPDVPFDGNPTQFERNGLQANPAFEDISLGTIQYGSPAKNRGLGLKNEPYLVLTDKEGLARPYWNKDYDIGAYEVQADAQFKINYQGNLSNPQFTISSLGTYWERNIDNEFVISENSTYSSSAYTVTVADQDTNNWKGWDFGWLHQSTSENNPFAHGIYKVSYGSEKYFYLDYRDAITNYSPNIFIKYDARQGYNIFEYLDLNKTFQPITNGSILRIWEKRGGTPNTNGPNGLDSYWNHALVWVNSNNHANLIWGKYIDPNITEYTVHRSYNGWHTFGVSSTTYNYVDDLFLTIPGGEAGTDVNFYITGVAESYITEASNYVVVNVEEKEIGKTISNNKNYSYELFQNYPNPFNPVTKITFSLMKPEYVSLKIYDILGRELGNLVNEKLEEGSYNYDFNASNLASGLYIYRIIAGKFTETKKMQLLK